MELFIIRHAQSHNNALADQRDRVVDPPLTEIGLRQADLVAQHFATGIDHEDVSPDGAFTPLGGGIEKLYCSAMLRALQTATAIGRALNLKPRVWTDIHEEGGMWLDHPGQGVRGYPGMARGQIAERFPDCILPDDITDTGWWRYGQEEWQRFMARTARVAAKLREDALKDTRIALVTHGGLGGHLLRLLVGAPIDANVFFHHDNTGITRVRFRPDGRVSVRYQNRVDHLPPDLVT